MADIVSLTGIAPSERARLIGDATAVFYETAHIQEFKSPPVKDAFYGRWFGNYLETQPASFFMALDGGGSAIGYLAGCLDSFSDAARIIVDDIDYYTPAFIAAMQGYPSHFHINMKPGQQGKGVGRRLVARFIQQCRDSGSSGIHVATGADSHAVKFYETCGFKRLLPLPEADPGLAVLVYATVAP